MRLKFISLLFFFLTFFFGLFIFITPSFAYDNTFTASNVSLDAQTNILSFDISNFSSAPNFPPSNVQLRDVDDNTIAYSYSDSYINCNTSFHCSVTLSYFHKLYPISNVIVRINIWDGAHDYFSQDLNWTDIALPTPASPWTRKMDMPTYLSGFGITTDPLGKIYIVNGLTDTVDSQILYIYDAVHDSWQAKSSLPYPGNGLGLTYYAPTSKLYAGGGWYNGSLNNFYEYDIATDTWTKKADMPNRRNWTSLLAAPNGKIYAVGGDNDVDLIASVDEYDPATDTWTEKTPIPIPTTAEQAIIAPNGKIYVFGGHQLGPVLNAVQEYDPATDTWTEKASMPTPLSDMGLAVNAQGNIEVIGGYALTSSTNEVEEYNPNTDTWTVKANFPFATYSDRAALGNDGLVHVFGGLLQAPYNVNTNFAEEDQVDNTPTPTETPTPTPTATLTPTPTDTPTPTPVPNVAPEVASISVAPNPVQILTSVTATTTFTDANTGDTHTAVADWDDGLQTTCTITESNGSGSVTCPRSSGYLSANVYSPRIIVTDNYISSGDSPDYHYLAVYNPTPQGLFSGASKFSSPAGAYPTNPPMTGQVKFGVSSKYQNGAATGKVSMDFKAANLTFDATVNTLVTASGKATLYGTGTIQGRSGTFNVLVTGSDSANTIRFQITDPSNNNAVIYDSQIGAEDTADPIAPVTGHITVH